MFTVPFETPPTVSAPMFVTLEFAPSTVIVPLPSLCTPRVVEGSVMAAPFLTSSVPSPCRPISSTAVPLAFEPTPSSVSVPALPASWPRVRKSPLTVSIAPSFTVTWFTLLAMPTTSLPSTCHFEPAPVTKACPKPSVISPRMASPVV